MRVDRVGLMAKRTREPIGDVVRDVARVLTERGCRLLLDVEAAGYLGRSGEGRARRTMVDQIDLAVCLGGDGNLLAVARRFAPGRTPIIGVNIGRIGFLAEVEPAEFEDFFEAYLDGRCVIEDRMMLESQLVEPGGRSRSTVPVLNDIVITKAALARMLDFELSIGGELVSRYRADGLIIATPTGSTAYSLAAGGPIITPLMGAIVISPICPHALSQRPLVVPDTSEITVRLDSENDGVYLSLDGQVGLPMAAGAELSIRRSALTASLVREPSLSFFELLRVKLGWGEG